MLTCVFDFPVQYSWCTEGANKEPKPSNLNLATEAKMETVSAYAASWIHKVLKWGYGGVVFFDCMCNSGSYIIPDNYPYRELQGQVSNGTSAKIHKLFQEAALQYKDKEFVLILNDYNKNQILCQCCRLETPHMSNEENQYVVEIQKNYKIIFYNQDANDLLSRIEIRNILKKHFHMLLFYDPYQCEIDWSALEWYIKNRQVDIILNHMISDVCRGISSARKIETKLKYQKSYRTPTFEHLEKELSSNINPTEKYNYLRLLIRDIITKISPTSKAASSPFFNQNRTLMYDLMIISESEEARKLFKNTTYRILKKRFADINEQNNGQLSLFPKSESDYKEYEYYSSIGHFADVVHLEFNGRGFVSIDEVNLFLDNHEYLPSNCLRELAKELRDVYQVVKNRNGYNFSMRSVSFE